MSDIKLINGKYYDFGCSNESFLTTAKELKTLGIKNYYFMLLINNPRVADIDPFNPSITSQEIQILMEELKTNLWFYARTVARVRSDAGVVPFGLHRGLAASIWCFINRYDACLCEPRQTWKTTGLIASIFSWSFQLSQNLNMHFFGKESENTKRNLATLRDDIELLPKWLQFEMYKDNSGNFKKTRKSTEILENKLMGNKLSIHPKPNSIAHAMGMARGASAAIIYFDEIEHTPFFDIILSNSSPAFKTAADNAKTIGAPYGRVFTTTPGNLDTKEGMASYPIIQSMIPWTEKIYDMDDAQIKEYISAVSSKFNESDESEKSGRESVDIFYLEYQYYQVRKNNEWIMEQYKLSGDKMAVRREILLQRLRGSNESPISPEDIEFMISNMIKSDNELLINNKWLFKLYEHGQKLDTRGNYQNFDTSIPYLVGIDPASGAGGDNLAIIIVNPYNLRIAAEFKNKYISLKPLLGLLTTLVRSYVPKAILIPERNSLGIYLIQSILEIDEIRDNLYWKNNDRELDNAVDESYNDYEMKEMSNVYKKYGTYVTPKVRNAMFELLFRHISECRDSLVTEYLVNDLCKLVRVGRNKRIEAVKGESDDMVMAYNHIIYIYHTGDNLAHFGLLPENMVKFDNNIEIDETDTNISYTAASMTDIRDIVFENIDVEQIIICEEQNKMIAQSLSFVDDDDYEYNEDLSGNHEIGFSFFELINGL